MAINMLGFLTVGALVGGTFWVRQKRRYEQSLLAQITDVTTEKEQLQATVSLMEEQEKLTAHALTGVLFLDNLETIAGLTPHHARLLNQAGILTFHDLSETNSSKILQILAPSGGPRLDVNRWIEQAAQLATKAPLPNWYGGAA